ncbi:electron transport complex subunit RsxG [Shewanella sp. OPT22]|nr:electron transport complex subunit RsxG [Shewanella sp. OPT22]
MSNPVLKNGLILAVFAMLCTAAVSVVNKVTEGKIAEQKQLQRLKVLEQIIPMQIHDNNLVTSCRAIVEPKALGTEDAVSAFVAFKKEQATAIAIEAVAPDGYNGNIKLIVAADKSGNVLGVRTLEQNETPGLGDKIELSKSNWVKSFNGKSLDNTSTKQWKVKKDGGEFDQFTGATITPRAYVKAVHKALDYIHNNFDMIVRQSQKCEDHHE